MRWILGLAMAVLVDFSGEGFHQVGEGHGVKVYRRDPKQGIELGADGIIAGTPEEVRKVLLDYEHCTRWVKGLAISRVLARGDNYLDVYQRLDLPLLDDRDYTLHVTWGQEGERLWLRFVTANDRGPKPTDGVVRVAIHEGGWDFVPVDKGRVTRATYRFHLDLAGSLPGWMGRGRAASDVPQLFENVRHQLPQPQK